MMKAAEFERRLSEFRRAFARMDFSPGDPGQIPMTKLSGVPWWPAGMERPICIDGHPLAFVGQFRLDEVPDLGSGPSLLSFHYCDQCAYAGKMPWGWKDKGKQARYRLIVLSDLTLPADGLGIVAASAMQPQVPQLHRGTETLNVEAIWEQFPKTAKPGGIPKVNGDFHEERSKLGGWPSWVQTPLRPEDSQGQEMQFVAQLDLYDSPHNSWATGYAYLFVSDPAGDEPEAELVIQTT